MTLFSKEKLLENWILKIAAIFLAWILWLFIQGESGMVTGVAAPVKIQLPTGMEISSDLPPPVQVTMRGARQELECIINLEEFDEGEHRITLTDEHIKSPRGLRVEVSQVNPSHVTLMLEKTVSKTVDIAVQVQGKPADGFQIYETIPNPKEVEITGPRSHIVTVEEVATELIALNGQNQSANFKVDLNFEDGTISSSMSDKIWVEIRIGPQRQDYTVKDVPLSLRNESLVVSTKKIDIRVLAPENFKEALVPDNFSAAIASQDLDEADFPVIVKPIISFQESWIGRIKIMGITPPEVTIHKIDSESPNQ